MILAIDQSYSGTGVAYITSDGRIQADCIKTPSGISWETRWDTIIKAINSYFDGGAIKLENPTKVKYVVIESYAFSYGGVSKIFQLGELGGIIKYNFHQKGLDVTTILIQHPKMYVALNGSAKKPDIIRSLRLRFGIDVKNDNVADAISIGLTFKAYLKWQKKGTLGEAFNDEVMRKVDTYIKSQKELVEAGEKHSKLKPKRKSSVKSDLYIGKTKTEPLGISESILLGIKATQAKVKRKSRLSQKQSVKVILR